MIMTYKEVFSNVWSIRKNSSFSSWLTRDNFFDSTHKGVLLTPWGNFFTTHRGLPLCLGHTRESFHDTVLYCGFG